MLIDLYPAEDVFARVPELAAQTDPVLRQPDPLLGDDPLFRLVRAPHPAPTMVCVALRLRGGAQLKLSHGET